MNIWFISDTHFSHENIIKYCNRPFKNSFEMDNQLINNWNNIVKKNDLIYHLGDFTLKNKEYIKKFINSLNGRKFIILGNHDKYKSTVYIEMGFEWASRFPIIYDKFFILSHEPVFLEYNSPYANIYGHLHQNNYIGPNKNYFNCSVEQIGYQPINYLKIKEILKNENQKKDNERN